MNIDPKYNILQVDIATFNNLALALDQNSDWIKLAQYFELYDDQEIRLLSLTSTPGNKLLNELGNKLCSVEILTCALRQCELYDALSLLISPEKIQVVQQPTDILNGRNSLKIANGDELKLEFIVVGIPPPKFAWFKDNVRLPGHNTNTFLCDNFNTNNAGTYYCFACQTLPNGEVERINSDKIIVEIIPYCQITNIPQELVCIKEGSPIFLNIEANGYPALKYQWIHGNSILNNDHNFFYIEKSEKHHHGEYRCIVAYGSNEICLKSKVFIYSESAFPMFKGPVPAKCALLIGNSDYTSHRKLATPKNDVDTLGEILDALGFRVYILQDLSLTRMKESLCEFVQILQKNSLVFFYFAGHGFQIRSNYLIPVDAPEDNPCNEALCDDEILKTVLKTEPSLFICLLDMCLNLPDIQKNPDIFKEAPEPIEFKSHRNLIRGWATTSHHSSYEKKNIKNGVYMNVLSKYLKQDDPPLPILTILEKVNADFEADHTMKNVQIPSFYTNVSRNFFLNLDLKRKTFD